MVSFGVCSHIMRLSLTMNVHEHTVQDFHVCIKNSADNHHQSAEIRHLICHLKLFLSSSTFSALVKTLILTQISTLYV